MHAVLRDDESGWTPEIELIDGIEVPKMSPKRRHAKLEGALAAILTAWAGDRGEVGTEWRFEIDAGAGHRNSYVPDVAYASLGRLAALDDELAEQPPFAPDIAVEIRSPGDRERNMNQKVSRYLEFGAFLVLDIDPASARIIAHSPNGVRVFEVDETFEHESAAGLRFSIRDLFAVGDRLRPPSKTGASLPA